MKKRLLFFIVMLFMSATSAFSAVNAVNDNYSTSYSSWGLSFFVTVDANDTYTGTPTVTMISTTHRGITLTGPNVTVAGGVPVGTYTIVYQLCDNATPQSCDTATVTVVIGTTVAAGNDEVIIPYNSSSVSLGNILTNDMIGSSAATTANSDFAILTSPLPTGLTYNSAGSFTSAGLAPGKYVIEYQLCEQVVFANPQGNCDTATFTIYVTTQNGPLTATRANNTVKVITVMNDHKIAIAGDFTSYGGVAKNKIARLNHHDLSLDTTFPCAGPDAPTDNIQSMVATSTGDLIVVGKFASFGGVSYGRGITRILPNGAVGSLASGIGIEAGATIYDIALQATGHMIIVGDFNYFDGFPAKNIARLNPNGSIDTSFNPGASFNGTPYSVAIQGLYNIIVGGSFTTYQGNPAPGIIRLLANAVQDPSFTTGPGIAPTGSYIDEVLVNGNDIFIGGSFSAYSGLSRKNLAKLAANGTPVATFTTGTGFSAPVRALAVQQVPASFSSNVGGYNLYVGGEFTSFNSVPVNYFTCLNAVTGQTNTLFDGGSECNNFVYAVTPEKNDLKILIGGSFTTYNGTTAQRITRIFPGYGAGNTGQSQMREGFDQEVTANSVSIYPNPSEGIFNIDFKGYDGQRFDVTIHNSLGQLIYKGVVTPQDTNQIDLSGFNSGSYFITLQNNAETINKIVIRK